MLSRTALSNLGSRVYGLGAVALGLVGLVWGDFAAVWQPVQAGVPHREVLAYVAADSIASHRHQTRRQQGREALLA